MSAINEVDYARPPAPLAGRCRSGCATKDHGSWGECARAAKFQIGDLVGRHTNKMWDRELDEYESAVKQGIAPPTTRLADTRAAVDQANTTGVARKYTT